MKLPMSDDSVEFERGGVLIGKQISSATIMFYTNRQRILVETPVPYYLITGKELDELVYRSWSNSAATCPEKMFSQPDRETAKLIATKIKGLFNLV
jgi:hypothetical protein